MAHLYGVEAEQCPGGGTGAEYATHAVGTARGGRKRVGSDRIVDARRHVVAEHDRTQKRLAGGARTLGDSKRRWNDGTSGMRA